MVHITYLKPSNGSSICWRLQDRRQHSAYCQVDMQQEVDQADAQASAGAIYFSDKDLIKFSDSDTKDDPIQFEDGIYSADS